MRQKGPLYIFFLLIIWSCLPGHSKAELVSKGVVNIPLEKLQQGEPVKLDGTWEFYWKQLVSPDSLSSGRSFREKPQTVRIPAYWTEYSIDGESLPGSGYATYHARLTIPGAHGDTLSLAVPVFDSAFKLFIDGKLRYKNGKVGTSTDSSVPCYRPGHIQFVAGEQPVDIVIQVSNFHHRRGGFWKPVYLGTPASVSRQMRHDNYFVFSALIFLVTFGIFYSIFAFYYREEKSLLYFSLSLWFVVVRSLVNDNFLINDLFTLSWTWLIRIEYLSTFLALMFFNWYYYYFYRNQAFYAWNRLVTYITVFCGLGILFLPVRIFAYSLFIFYALVFLSGILIFYFSLKMAGRKVLFARYHLIGISLILVIILHDILVANAFEIHYGEYLMKYGFVVFIYIETAIMLKRFVMTIRNERKLTSELELVNANLESLVNERTEEINQKREEIENKNRSISEQNKRLKEDVVSRNRLFSIIAHDLRSPLAVFVQVMELMDGDELDDASRRELRKEMKVSARSLVGLVDNLLVWGRSRNNQVQYELKRHSLNKILKNSIEQLEQTAQSKSIALTLDLNQEYEAVIDSNSIQLAVRNLVSNAIKFTPEGGSIKVFVRSVADNRLEIHVKDDGIGINEEDLQKLRQGIEFTSAGTNNEKGTGLGLQLCREIAHQNKGELEIWSKPGEGSDFVMSVHSYAKHSI
ncbi:sensor histidine kinase [Prolixibacter denitrificans]|uniref:histidine kinase n=1 Tax=Prolixibacter denitrificans TaxID=1541063 RepID=A0A2P8CGW9_9BACT|nr:sensor histidine kinase [Prolixibacter denitrificans]PSK84234.1 signal transduction histidine kinase [Prolixibacter denitrificans]GET20408.1 histidine kinase [Prolixibacter denitrificans]